MSPLTVSVLILGWLTTGENLSLLQGLGLAIVGLGAHGFGFGLNDLIDAPLDAAQRPTHPLQTGQLSRRAAGLIIWSHVPVTFGIYGVVTRGFDPLPALILTLSLIASLIYNVFSKWGQLPRLLAEISLAASIALLALAGAFATQTTPPTTSFFYALTLFWVLLLLNSIPSGLKDLKTDAAFGARSWVIVLGAKVEADDRLIIPPKLRIYTTLVGIGLLVSVGLTIHIFAPPLGLSLVSLGLFTYGGLHLRMLLQLKTFRQLRQALPLLSGYFHYFALALLLLPQMPLSLQLLYSLATVQMMMIPLMASLRVWQGKFRPL